MNAAAHRITAGAGIFLVMAHQEEMAGEKTAWPLAGGVAGSILTCLPDRIEPAIHPNHRQFFHSLVLAVGLGYCFLRIKDWEPQSREGTIVRKVALIGIAAYLVHLALDATTAKSLPVIGRI
jgi:inner membrane protein